MFHPQRKTMDPLVCLCLLTWSAGTAADHSPPVIKLVVMETSDAILPCSLSTSSIKEELFDWKRDRQEVFLYDKRDEYNNGRPGQDPQFKGRVFHFPEAVQSGNASIVIRNTQVSDSGTYTCDFPRHQPQRRSRIELLIDPILRNRYPGVKGAAPEPYVTTVKAKDGALLQCVVRGVSPQPKVEWKDSAGNILPAKEPQVTERGGSYDVILQAPLTKTDHFTCVVTQEDINHQISADIYVGPFNGAAPEPSVKVVKTKDGELLQCVVRGVSPQPKVEWKDSAGNILPAKEPQVTERGGSYDVILQAPLTKTDHFTCVVTQEDINHQISADTYARNDSTGLVVAVSVPIILLVVGVVLVQTQM
ncbi:butyrophilin subfamily 3 member A2-like isoform X2 [Dicentrarchus labrax]|uniref:butyrophilin subfamily 3 member A2-like isoform X2 n=1 Tax=Dicentrarchus labrax TaxID=13489 RepID=UPI0021F5E57B|nr:butyrophilin subfamily 3 member A2-like isoform X2 [Dicentrarchus labrax]